MVGIFINQFSINNKYLGLKKIIFIILLYNIYLNNIIINNKNQIKHSQNIYDVNFDYQNYQREMLSDKIKNYAGYEIFNNHPFFLNGIIRKLKPRSCLEIGTARGGTAIVILNALKDINDSFLISLDLNKKWYRNKDFDTGYRVKKYFPELANKWKLFTGSQPHIFLEKLNIKFDFLYLDTVHSTPGEFLNILEVLPFLNENAIIVIHDIMYHYLKEELKTIKFYPSNIYLFTTLFGDKIVFKDDKSGIENTGAVFLYKNQKSHYLDYFILLLSPWQYMPKKEHIEELKIFIKKYYKKDIYIYIFNKAVEHNQKYIIGIKGDKA